MQRFLPCTEWIPAIDAGLVQFSHPLTDVKLVRSTGKLLPSVGGYNVTYPALLQGKRLAIRFPTVNPDKTLLVERGKAIESLSAKHGVFVSTRFIEEGARIGSKVSAPLTYMEWVSGTSLSQYVNAHRADASALKNLARRWLALVHYLRDHGLAHGDLQGDNVFVRKNGDLVLIDLDTLYASGPLARLDPGSKGSPWLHHSDYQQLPHDANKDTFPAAAIYTALRLLTWSAEHKPRALEAYTCESGRLLFNEEDFRTPDASPLFGLASSLPTQERQLLERLYNAAKADVHHIPPLSTLCPLGSPAPQRAASAMEYFKQSAQQGPQRCFRQNSTPSNQSARSSDDVHSFFANAENVAHTEASPQVQPARPRRRRSRTPVVVAPQTPITVFGTQTLTPALTRPAGSGTRSAIAALPTSSPLRWVETKYSPNAPVYFKALWTTLQYTLLVVSLPVRLTEQYEQELMSSDWLGEAPWLATLALSAIGSFVAGLLLSWPLAALLFVLWMGAGLWRWETTRV